MIPRENYRDAGPQMARALVCVFAQLHAGLNAPPIITERIDRGWWNGSPLIGTRDPWDVKAHAAEFRARMRIERGETA